MGNLSKKEIVLLNDVVDELECEFEDLFEQQGEKDKLIFSNCLNNDEKLKYLKNELSKMQKRFELCPNNISGYLNAINFQLPNRKEDFRKRFNNILQNFILTDYVEAFDSLMLNKVEFDSYSKYFNNFYEFKDEWHLHNSLIEYSVLLYRFECFKEIFKENGSLHNIAEYSIENNEELETPTFENKFDNVSPVEIYKHFKAGLVTKGYLTEQELNEYLKAAFELKTKPKTLFKLKHTPTKQKIYTVFYIYYKDVSGKKHEQQTRYAELLGNYFEGYNTEIIKTNWARDYKTK